MVGTTISHYKISEKLGEGGMGVVYKATDTELNRPVALKFLTPHLLRDEEGRKRFRREAQAAAALDHPNICTVYEIGQAEDQSFIAMAYLEGRTLSKRIADGPLKLPEALSIAIQMAEGLEAAHDKGVVHRDIKPDNVMLMKGSRGLVKLMDFGLAQLAESSKLTREGTTLGTPIYMSPEQALGETTDQRSDVWALGVVLYEMVAGRPPFRGEVDQAVIYAIATPLHTLGRTTITSFRSGRASGPTRRTPLRSWRWRRCVVCRRTELREVGSVREALSFDGSVGGVHDRRQREGGTSAWMTRDSSRLCSSPATPARRLKRRWKRRRKPSPRASARLPRNADRCCLLN